MAVAEAALRLEPVGDRGCLHPRRDRLADEKTLVGCEAQTVLEGVADPVERVARTARVARAVYEAESAELGGLRGVSAFSPALKQLEEEFETIRYDMQRERLEALAAEGRMRKGLSMDDARRIMWMYTGREVYRMLVEVGGWSADKYEAWLAATLVDALVAMPERR
jgi:malonyl CoA-acyl carrier protein transacylase